MAITFKPKTEEEIEKEGILPDGSYPFTVVKAEETTSKKGKDMIAIELIVYADGGERLIRDYLLFDPQRKLHSFCREIGMLPEFNTGTIDAEDMVRKEGFAAVATEKQEGYPPKNVIRSYGQKEGAKAATSAAVKAPAKAANEDDSDIPF